MDGEAETGVEKKVKGKRLRFTSLSERDGAECLWRRYLRIDLHPESE
jgi:hypothetical protein